MSAATRSVQFTVNGQLRSVQVEPRLNLADCLRHSLGCTGTHVGCEHGVCGACTVLVDGVAARACVIPAAGVAGREITTLEGLGSADALHPVQQGFIDAQAAQCGYCLSGMIMMTASLLAHTPDPTELQIRQALSGNLCRCGTHLEIIDAVQRAARLMAQARTAAALP